MSHGVCKTYSEMVSLLTIKAGVFEENAPFSVAIVIDYVRPR